MKNKKIIRVMEGETLDIPPVWMMRQAGRYLPEYRELRARTDNFLDFCYTPELATEATLQPIRRFDLDAAIIFSDILVIPDVMGQGVRFEETRGPVLDALSENDIERLSSDTDITSIIERLTPVMEVIDRTKNELSDSTSLLGFCGAPWTIATYMIAGRGDRDYPKRFALEHPERFGLLIDTLTNVLGEFLVAQLRAGADAVQIFDSWASALDEQQFKKWCIEPTARIVSRVRSEIPDAKIIGFPRGIGTLYETYRSSTGVDMLSLDWSISHDFAVRLQRQGPVQGNLDPYRLLVGGSALDEAVDLILEHLSSGPLVFNLGHGIMPETPVTHVERFLCRIRGG